MRGGGGGVGAVHAMYHLRRRSSQINLKQNNYGKLMGVRVADGYTGERRRGRGRGLYIKVGLVAGGGGGSRWKEEWMIDKWIDEW